MPRYENAEGRSQKFWEVSVDGKSLKARFGKVGANGQTTVKNFPTEEAARRHQDKLVAEKVKEGYRLVKPPRAPVSTVPEQRNPELEQAIYANPHDRQAFAVLGDWLQERGDVRGELISLHLANKHDQARDFIERHANTLLGTLADHQEVHDEGSNNSRSHLRTDEQEREWQRTQSQAFLWRNGFIYRCRLSHDSYSDGNFDGETSDLLEDVLAHPSGRFIVEFAFQSNGDPNENDLQSIIDVLARHAPPTTRKITFGDNVDQISWHHTGNLARLWPRVQGLTTFEIETGEFEVGAMSLPALERAVFITGGLTASCGKDIATAKLPSVKHLEIYYGTANYGGTCTLEDVLPLLERTDLPNLRYLGLKNSEFADDIARAMKGAKVLAGLETLDLSRGTMSDAGALALAAARDSLKHLKRLDLTRNFLTDEGIRAVQGLCPVVITDDQEDAEDEDDRYVSISE